MKLVSNSQRILYELFIQEYRDNAASCIWKSLSTLGVRHAILINAVTRDRSAVQALQRRRADLPGPDNGDGENPFSKPAVVDSKV